MAASNVVPLKPAASAKPAPSKAFTELWGSKIADHGYTQVPKILFAMQSHLKLKPTEMLVLLHLASFWWVKGNLPWPSKSRLASRIGIQERQVQRVLTKLEKLKLIRRIARRYKSGGQSSNAYDLTGLVDRLNRFEPKYRAMKEENKARQDEVESLATGKRKAGSPPVSK